MPRTAANVPREPKILRWAITFNEPPGYEAWEYGAPAPGPDQEKSFKLFRALNAGNLTDVKSLLDNVSSPTSHFKYFIWQMERGGNSEHLHAQAYLHGRKQTRFTQLKREFFGRYPHLEKAEGTARQNIDYCSKAETRVSPTYYEIGEQPSAQGHRSDLADVARSISDNPTITVQQLALNYPATFMRYHSGIRNYHELTAQPPERPDCAACFLYGSTGGGKSILAQCLAGPEPYEWTAGSICPLRYKFEKTMICEDLMPHQRMVSNTTSIPPEMICQMLSTTRKSFRTLYGSLPWHVTMHIYESNYTLDELYEKYSEQTRDAVKRRFRPSQYGKVLLIVDPPGEARNDTPAMGRAFIDCYREHYTDFPLNTFDFIKRIAATHFRLNTPCVVRYVDMETSMFYRIESGNDDVADNYLCGTPCHQHYKGRINQVLGSGFEPLEAEETQYFREDGLLRSHP